MSKEIKWIPFDIIEKTMMQLLIKFGVPQNDAKIVSDVLIKADQLGIDSHGVNRLKAIYLDRIKEGVLNPITKIDVIKDKAATAVIDGNNGMGHVIAKLAMQKAIDKAKIYGLGMVAVRNSTHYGIAGYYSLMATQENMIGITGTNARPSIAPTFGVENMMGTNPLTFGIPTDEDFPFLLDCATSVTQRGKIEIYAREKKDVPQGWVIDEQGKTKTDSVEILDDLIKGKAALTPLGGIGEETGGYKGYGYALVVEILSAALQSGAFMKMLLGFKDGKKVPYPLGHFFIAIDVDAFNDVDEFKKITGDILREIRASKKAPGHNQIFTPGEKEYIKMTERINKGVPFNSELLKEFHALCVDNQLDESLVKAYL
ncbi:MAG: Ldh family oxidoreductase [Bacteroidales bacterium]|nr:Ldh family oxidoreductase [Bacteroidales bacterium]MDY0217269.1 Ldh family oxidoreductase [Bacteroidales bacterium]